MSKAGLSLRAGIAALLTLGELALCIAQSPPPSGPSPTAATRFPDATGIVDTFTTNGSIDTQNPFFQTLGTNGRTCNTCHVASDGWSVTPAHLLARFIATRGLDPIFRPVDGTNSPSADMSTTDARRIACSMLLTKGLIRVGIGIPANAEFSLVGVDDPYGYASAKELSLFRRPLPATNLRFLSTVMWDGRESVPGETLDQELATQALDATTGHAQASTPPSQQQLQQIVDFEMGLSTAQAVDFLAGPLDAFGATGGPDFLPGQDFYIGINDPVGFNPTGAAFDPNAFTLFTNWAAPTGEGGYVRQSTARGEALFNTKPITITGVAGLNDRLNLPVIHGTCTTCHDSPNVGNHSIAFPLNIGLADASRRTPDLPLYTLRNNTTGATVQTTDPGRALITGKWADIGKFKGPILRGLAARPPYFHNGSAATLEDVITFYDTRFNIGFTAREKQDLIAFLRSL